MEETNAYIEEEPKLNGAAVETEFHTEPICVNIKDPDSSAAIECLSGGFANFGALGKEELMKYANDPFWKRLRLMLHILFWVGWNAMLVAAAIIIALAPRCPSRAKQKWYDRQVVYEILTESFQDTDPESQGVGKEGAGIGDIKGITARVNYFLELKSNVLYINSIYRSDDNDHMAVVDHKSIDSALGTMEDFDQLRKVTKKKQMRIIMDFIPNHTGKTSEWFKKSQRKEGKYTEYYVWAQCDTKSDIYPNNWMSLKGGRAWTYDDIREECYLHQLENDKPDLNLWNTNVRQELEDILRFWLNKGVDGFHILNPEYLYEDQNFGDEILMSGKEGNAYDDFKHNQTSHHSENLKLLSVWKSILDAYSTKPGREKVLVVTAKDDVNSTMKYFEAGATIVRVTPFSDTGFSLTERIEAKLSHMDIESNRFGWMYSNKDSSRLASLKPEQVKALMTLQATLPGVPFVYYGNEIGMTDHPSLPEPLKYRTPMQWNMNGTGFSKNTKWLAQNPNYVEINVEEENAVGNDFTILKVFRKLSFLTENESFQWGHMNLFREKDLLMFTRKTEGFPGYLVAMNLGSKREMESFHGDTGIPKNVKVVFHTHTDNNTVINLSDNSSVLEANHAIILEYE
ncbi:amino acid transporter heavy chain SLC3A1-like [Saccostrea cucullata]|uniref:amino acid transporter heavy chain SLC3A1-like n=1 Tax=Saccostrea cuccullata TaxID=36930 RepID=UPI002ED00179